MLACEHNSVPYGNVCLIILEIMSELCRCIGCVGRGTNHVSRTARLGSASLSPQLSGEQVGYSVEGYILPFVSCNVCINCVVSCSNKNSNKTCFLPLVL